MRRGHVHEALGAYLDGELSPGERREAELHLAHCARCREALERVRRGAELAGGIEIERLPGEAEERILRAIRDEGERTAGAAPRSRGVWWVAGAPLRRAVRWSAGAPDPRAAGRATGAPGRPGVWWAVAAAAAAAGAVFIVLQAGPRVSVQSAEGPPTRIEAVALAARARLVEERSPLDLATGSPAEVRSWLEERGLSAALALDRPSGERARFALLGASDVSRPGLRAAAVSYRIDGRPVLLIAARQDEVPDAPRWGPLGKRVLYRREDGVHLLSWTNSGRAYTLVSDLPGRGQKACLLCHTDAERRRLIERLGEGEPGT